MTGALDGSQSPPVVWNRRHVTITSLLTRLQSVIFDPLQGSETISREQDYGRALNKGINLLGQLESDERRGVRPRDVHSSPYRALLRELKTQSLHPETDFEVSCSLSVGPHGKVEVVETPLSSAAGPAQLYVLKTTNKPSAIRMRQHLRPLNELRILARARDAEWHPPIPRLHAAFQTDSSLHLLTSYAPGGDLASLLSKLSQIHEKYALHFTAMAVLALGWLHEEAGYVHRDVKPENLVLDWDGKLLLTDFASAAEITDEGVLGGHGPALAGTPDYIAPEVLLAHEEAVLAAMQTDDPYTSDPVAQSEAQRANSIGPASDFWSLGATIYELLYGKTPFFAPSIPATYEKICNHSQFLSFPSTQRVSRLLTQLLKGLLSDAARRHTFATIKAHPVFAAFDWRDPPSSPFVPALKRPSGGVNSPSDGCEDLSPAPGGGFNFSAFFEASSPGLSILRNSAAAPQSHLAASADEFEEFGWLPPADEFSSPPAYTFPPDYTDRVAQVRDEDFYRTPLRPRPSTAALRAAAEGVFDGAPVPGSSRKREGVASTREGLLQIMRTAQKRVASSINRCSLPAPGPIERNTARDTRDGVEGQRLGLEERVCGLRRDLDAMESQYASLFRLASEAKPSR